MKTVLTLDEAAEFLKVHPSTVYRLFKKKQIPAFKIGADWRFNAESIERGINEREQAEVFHKNWPLGAP
jgi:excisionase family DNA binding protein